MPRIPSTIPRPLVSGYTVAPAEQTVRTDMEVGPARVRRRTSAPPDQVTLTWRLTDAQMATFADFFGSPLGAAGGAAWIDLDLSMARVQAYPEYGPLQPLISPDAMSSLQFGFSAALSADGRVLAVGARGWQLSGVSIGGVYIYDRIGAAWVQRGPVLYPSNGVAGDNYGSGVALSADGRVLAVGAWLRDGTHTDQGAVYIYDWTGTTWVQRGAMLVAHDPSEDAMYGASVALSADGRVLAVGAAYDDLSGSVYTYTWTGSAWALRQKLTAADAAAEDEYGIGVALDASGSILAVGAQGWEGPLAQQGGVYIYDWTGTTWTQRGPVIQAPMAEADAYAGRVSMSSDGQILLIGAQMQNAHGYPYAGGAHIMRYTSSGWVGVRSYLSPFAGNGNFGLGTAMSGDASVIAIGAPYANTGGGGHGILYTANLVGGGVRTVQARFVGPYQATLEPGMHWTVTANMEVRRA